MIFALNVDDKSPALFVLGPMKLGVALPIERRAHNIDNRISLA
jgi:hypothetical protein